MDPEISAMGSIFSKRGVGEARLVRQAIIMTKTITTVIVTVGRVRECSIRDAAIYALHGDREALILLTYYI